MVGTANVSNFCGIVGAQYTDAIVPIPAGALSTYSFNVTVGGEFPIQSNFFNADFTKRVEIADLECPTWGIGTAAATVTGYGNMVVGPPFLPLVSPPPQLQSFDPHWAKCSFITEDDHLISWAIFDPPHALTRVTAMGPDSTSVLSSSSQVTSSPHIDPPQSLPATPANAPLSPFAPPTTNSPVGTASSIFPATPEKTVPADPDVSTSKGSHSSPGPASQASTARVQTSPDPTKGQDPDTEPKIASSLGSAADPQIPLTTPISQNIGDIIYSAFGKSPNNIADKSPNPVPGPIGTALPDFVFEGSTLTADLQSQYLVGNQEVVPGAHAITVSGTFVSMDRGAARLIVGSSTIEPSTAAVASEVFSAVGTSAIAVGGTALTTGGSAATVSGKIYSMGPSGKVIVSTLGAASMNVFTLGAQPVIATLPAVVIGSKTLTPGDPDTTASGLFLSPVSSVFTVDGHTITANPTAMVVDSTSLTPGAPGITVAGTFFSLDESGVAVIGSSTLTLTLPTSSLSVSSVFGAGGQTFTAPPSVFSIDGTTLTAGGPGVLISGTPVSLEPSGVLAIGNTSINLLPSLAGGTNTSTDTGAPFLGGQGRVKVPGFTIMVFMPGLLAFLYSSWL